MVKVLSSRLQQCLGRLRCCLLKGSLKRDFLVIFLITFFGVRNFENTWAMRVTFLFENAQHLMYISEMPRRIEEKWFVSAIIVSELVGFKFPY